MRQLLAAAGPIALGHLVSVALVAAAAVQGVPRGQGALLGGTALLLALLGASCLRRHRPGPARAGLALASFFATTLHGAGLVLVPALLPLCLPADPGHPGWRTGPLSAALWPLLAACALHTAVMLGVGGALAVVVSRVRATLRRRERVRLSPSPDPDLHPP